MHKNLSVSYIEEIIFVQHDIITDYAALNCQRLIFWVFDNEDKLILH